MTIRSYSELSGLPTFIERFRYLQLRSQVGVATFGFDRYVNQKFYTSAQWRRIRDQVITRDLGCDLGLADYEIHGKILIHHMNPMTRQDIEAGRAEILNPDFLISVTHNTHNAIHYGDENLLSKPVVERSPGDTRLW